MLVTVPRLIGVVAAIQALYLGVTALAYFASMSPDEPFGEIFWRAFWPIAFACGAYALWMPRPPRYFLEALVRTGLIALVFLGNVMLVVSLLS